MAVSGRRRSDEDRVVRYLNTEGDFEVDILNTRNKPQPESDDEP